MGPDNTRPPDKRYRRFFPIIFRQLRHRHNRFNHNHQGGDFSAHTETAAGDESHARHPGSNGRAEAEICQRPEAPCRGTTQTLPAVGNESSRVYFAPVSAAGSFNRSLPGDYKSISHRARGFPGPLPPAVRELADEFFSCAFEQSIPLVEPGRSRRFPGPADTGRRDPVGDAKNDHGTDDGSGTAVTKPDNAADDAGNVRDADFTIPQRPGVILGGIEYNRYHSAIFRNRLGQLV